MKYRSLKGFALSLPLAFMLAAGARADDKTLTISAPGGTFEQWIRKDIIPGFKAKTGIDVVYVAASATDLLAKLQAQKGNQQIDVGFFDEGPVYQAIDLGFCGELAPAPVYGDVYEQMKFKSNKAVYIGLVATGITYNKKVFDENKWPAPTSWADLADPKYRGKLVVFPLNSTYGVDALVMAARMKGGGESNIEPGFKAFKDEIGPNVLVYEPSPANVTELFHSGQVLLAVYGSGRTKSMADMGFPLEFVYPKEGGVALAEAVCPIAGTKNEKAAQAFIQYLLSPEAQVSFAAGVGFAPVNSTVQLSPEAAKGIPTPDEIKKLIVLDWDTINRNRDDWNKRWTREIER